MLVWCGSRLGFGGLRVLSLQSLFLHARTAAREEKGTSAPPLELISVGNFRYFLSPLPLKEEG